MTIEEKNEYKIKLQKQLEQLKKIQRPTIITRKNKKGETINASEWLRFEDSKTEEVQEPQEGYNDGRYFRKGIADVRNYYGLKASKKIVLMYIYKKIIEEEIKLFGNNQNNKKYSNQLLQNNYRINLLLDAIGGIKLNPKDFSQEDLKKAQKEIIRFIHTAKVSKLPKHRCQLSKIIIYDAIDELLKNHKIKQAASLGRVAEYSNLFSKDGFIISTYENDEFSSDARYKDARYKDARYNYNITNIHAKIEKASDCCETMRKNFVTQALLIYCHSKVKCMNDVKIIEISIDKLVQYDEQKKHWDFSHIKSETINKIAEVLEERYSKEILKDKKNSKISFQTNKDNRPEYDGIRKIIDEAYRQEMTEIKPKLGTLYSFFGHTDDFIAIPNLCIDDEQDFYGRFYYYYHYFFKVPEFAIELWEKFDDYYKSYIEFIDNKYGPVKKK